jgi:hypothetical protein
VFLLKNPKRSLKVILFEIIQKPYAAAYQQEHDKRENDLFSQTEPHGHCSLKRGRHYPGQMRTLLSE